MPTESEYGEDIQLLDDLTRLKLRLIDKVKTKKLKKIIYCYHCCIWSISWIFWVKFWSKVKIL